MRKLTVLGITLLASFAMIAAVAPAASARIVPQEGMKGIKLDQRKYVVIRKLGTPTRIERGTNDFGKFQVLHYGKRFDVTVENRFVVQIRTTGKGQRTATGVGVGSKKWQVKNGVPGVVCERSAGTLSCHLGDFSGGNPITDFEFQGRKVNRVIIARILD